MARVGLVIEATEKEARLLTSLRGICDGCSGHSSCSIGHSGPEKSEMVTASNPIKAKPGEYVEFDLAEGVWLKVSLIVWAVPLVGLIFGAFVGASLHERFSVSQDIGVLLGAVSGFLGVFASVTLFDRCSAGKKEFIPMILKVVKPLRSEELQTSPSGTETVCIDKSFTTRSSGLPLNFSPHDPGTDETGSPPR